MSLLEHGVVLASAGMRSLRADQAGGCGGGDDAEEAAGEGL